MFAFEANIRVEPNRIALILHTAICRALAATIAESMPVSLKRRCLSKQNIEEKMTPAVIQKFLADSRRYLEQTDTLEASYPWISERRNNKKGPFQTRTWRGRDQRNSSVLPHHPIFL